MTNTSHLPTITRRRAFAGLASLTAFTCAGCPSKPPAVERKSPDTPPRVMVIDDESLAKQLAREWLARTETELPVATATAETIRMAKRIPADVLIFPTMLLGELAAAERIVPLPDEVTDAAGWERLDVFDIAKRQEIAWGRSLFALPLGSPPLILWQRKSAEQTPDPPATWPELIERVKQASGEAAEQSPRPFIAPLKEGAGARTLLAIAACYVADGEQVSILFDRGSLKPRIDQPPFVRALTELVALVRAEGGEPLVLSDEETSDLLLTGKAAWGIGCMGRRVGDDAPPSASASASCVVSSLPGSRDTFNFSTGEWRSHDEVQRATLVGCHGTLVAVTDSARRPTQAWSFAAWATNAETSAALAPHSPRLAPFRDAHLAQSDKFADLRAAGELASQYGRVVQETQRRQIPFTLPRLPHIHEYLQALDAAVLAAVREEQSPAAALTAAAERWEAITEKAGLAKQRQAYSAALEAAVR